MRNSSRPKIVPKTYAAERRGNTWPFGESEQIIHVIGVDAPRIKEIGGNLSTFSSP
jgi:hypothetical protein